jgi:hypothetical protein
MEWHVPESERIYLRELAARQAEYARLPVMDDRKRMWYALNDGQTASRPPFVVETWTFDRDFMPEGVLRCTSDTGRGIEWQLLRNIRNYELLNDDKVMPDTFDIGWFVGIDEFGVKIENRWVKDAQGYEMGYETIHPIKDLKRDLDLLKPAACSVDRDGTLEWKSFLEDLLGDLLPVKIRTSVYGNMMLTHRVIHLMGMESFFMAMYDSPEEVHRLMAFLRDNALRVMKWAEQEGLLLSNNGNEDSFGSSYNFTTQLPAAGYTDGPARLCDMWGSANSQETVGIAPEMFHEFCSTYYSDVCEPVGLLYYGCCEPVHPFWDDIQRLPHLNKVSISRWCDQGFMGEALKGRGIVFSRKPDPRFLGVDVKLDEDAWRSDIRETLLATRGVPLEFIVRDVYTVHGDLGKVRRAIDLAREETAACF